MDMAVRTSLCSPLVLVQGGRRPVPTVGTAAWCLSGSLGGCARDWGWARRSWRGARMGDAVLNFGLELGTW